MDLFEKNESLSAPLAERMRPKNLTDFLGQEHLIGKSKILRTLIETGDSFSLILWGPPGVGKTTLAKLMATHTKSEFISISAVTSGIQELKEYMNKAQDRLRFYRKKTILFIDEIHRFNRTQQDYLLPFVEKGIITLIGATTENPSFEIISPLLSRTKVLTLERLSAEDLKKIIHSALSDTENGLGKLDLKITPQAADLLSEFGNGDARSLLNTLEWMGQFCIATHQRTITPEVVISSTQKKNLYYDKNHEEHYNLISAFIKSMRGSDPDAAIYWMCRMLEAGEDPLFIARRMIVFASEDIGNADPHALPLAIATMQAIDMIGLPEAKIPMSQAATYLATAPKNNAAYVALQEATKDVLQKGNLDVPMHLRNAPTKLMKDLGYSKGYQYAHHYKDAKVTHDHLPSALKGKKYYSNDPSVLG